MSGCAGRNSAARSNFCDGRSICSGVNCDCCLAGNGIQFCRSGFTEIEVTIAVKLGNGRLSVRERQEGTITLELVEVTVPREMAPSTETALSSEELTVLSEPSISPLSLSSEAPTSVASPL